MTDVGQVAGAVVDAEQQRSEGAGTSASAGSPATYDDLLGVGLAGEPLDVTTRRLAGLAAIHLPTRPGAGHRALRMSRRLGDLGGVLRARSGLAWFHVWLGRHTDSLDECRRATDLVRHIDDPVQGRVGDPEPWPS